MTVGDFLNVADIREKDIYDTIDVCIYKGRLTYINEQDNFQNEEIQEIKFDFYDYYLSINIRIKE